MNTTLFDRPGETQAYIQSLALSVLLHGAIVGLAIFLLSDLQLVPQPEPFKWNVSVIEAPAVEQQESSASAASQPAPATQTEADHPPVETKPAVQTKLAAPRVVRKEARETKPVEQASPQATTQASHPAVNRMTEPIETSTQSASVPADAPEPQESRPADTEPPAQPPTQTEAPVTKPTVAEPTPITRPEPSAVSRPAMEAKPDAAMMQEQPAAPGTKEAPPATTSEPMVAAKPPAEAKQAPETVQERDLAKEGTAQSPEPPPTQQASLTQPSMQAAPPAKADYGWMLQALRSRVEQLKRYPPLARKNEWEGQVVVRAVLKEDGSLVDLKVDKSSGHQILDEDALEVLRQVSPLKLQRPLGKPQIIVKVPIRYEMKESLLK